MNPLLTELDQYIQENRYSKHPFMVMLSDEKITKVHLKKWAIQKYHQTYLQNVTFSAIHANSMHYEDIRQFQMHQLIGEETSISDGSNSHYNLMKNFAVAMGATHEEIKNSKASKGVKKFVNYMHQICKTKHPVLAMLAIYVNERQTPESANKMYAILKRRFLLNENELEWFSVHGEADVEHADVAKDLIVKYADDCENFQEEAWNIVKNGVEEWTNLQNCYVEILR